MPNYSASGFLLATYGILDKYWFTVEKNEKKKSVCHAPAVAVAEIYLDTSSVPMKARKLKFWLPEYFLLDQLLVGSDEGLIECRNQPSQIVHFEFFKASDVSSKFQQSHNP
jgi:hypothetical protein